MKTRLSRAEAMLLAYLEKNPGAGDTFDGVAEFWWHFEWADRCVEDAREIIERLIEKGLVRKVRKEAGRPEYCVGPESGADEDRAVYVVIKKRGQRGP